MRVRLGESFLETGPEDSYEGERIAGNKCLIGLPCLVFIFFGSPDEPAKSSLTGPRTGLPWQCAGISRCQCAGRSSSQQCSAVQCSPAAGRRSQPDSPHSALRPLQSAAAESSGNSWWLCARLAGRPLNCTQTLVLQATGRQTSQAAA